MKNLLLPKSAQKLFKDYRNLKIQGNIVVAPYHINTNLRGNNRALVGKGRPEEIERAAERYLAKYQMNAKNNPEQLLKYLSACGIGIDCSGFAAWILNCVTLEKLNKPIYRCVKFPNLKRRIIGRMRPFENLSANLLTNSINTIQIDVVSEIQPGDMIRIINGGHVMVISEIGLTNEGSVEYLRYMHSTVGYGEQEGVESSTIQITDQEKSLFEQIWSDELIFKDIKKNLDSSRVVRLKALI